MFPSFECIFLTILCPFKKGIPPPLPSMAHDQKE